MYLSPLKDVSDDDTGYRAMSSEPWLEITGVDWGRLAGRYAELSYSASYWDDPVRPLLRFELGSGGVVEHIAAAPVAGSAMWVGRIPKTARRLSISPTNRTGPFSFAILSLRPRRWLTLIRHGFRHAPRAARSAILTLLIGWGPESDSNMAWAVGTHRLSGYRDWRRARARPLDLRGLDRPRSDWRGAAPIHLWLTADRNSASLELTIASVLGQVFPKWVLHVAGPPELRLPDDDRIRRERGAESISDGEGLVSRLVPGDELPPYALGCVHEAALRHADAKALYGDEEIKQTEGQVQPLLKPGWSPLLHQQLPFLGRSLFIRSPASDVRLQNLFDDPSEDRHAVASPLFGRDEVVPIRRILLRTEGRPSAPAGNVTPAACRDASVALIIPTKDHADDLRRLISSIRKASDLSRVRLVIIDNGSVDAAARALLQQIGAEKNVQVIDYPKAFNYSLMCNMGASAARSDVLVFLNNDVEVLSPGWLERLTAWALRPEIGAVGAKLTYPNGLIQHIGVVLGMGGSAGHFGSLSHPASPGWAGRHLAVHEVAAVTGACLAVAATKFEAVKGFDATNLPVELSDIDLCLKLAERGWHSIVDSFVHLMHEESASRGGATFRRLSQYSAERDFFTRRWRHVLRDDPYFHPGLSLFDREAALG